MSTTFVFPDNVNTTLAAAITSSATSIQLASSANLPVVGADEILVLTLNDAATGQIFEVVYCQGPISGSTLTNCLRGQEGTTALNWNIGDRAYCSATAGILRSFLQNSPFAASSNANPGYRQYADGTIENFGLVSGVAGNASTPATPSYGLPFTTAVLSVTFGVQNNYGSNPAGFLTPQYQTTLTTLTFWLPGGSPTSTAGVSWRAIGY